jgi:hypothetical protein
MMNMAAASQIEPHLRSKTHGSKALTTPLIAENAAFSKSSMFKIH